MQSVQAFASTTGPVIIAHRGGSLEAPENTIAAVKHGAAAGADWVEIDVTLSKDEQVIVVHDDTLERTTDGEGEVTELTVEQIQRHDAGDPVPTDGAIAAMAQVGVTAEPFGDRFKGERVPTFREVLEAADIPLMVELKAYPDPRKLVDRVVADLRLANAQHRAALGSFETDLLWAANDKDPSIPLIGIVANPDKIDEMLRLPIRVLAVNTALADLALAKAPRGVSVWTWTVYDVDTAVNLRGGGVHGLITDIPLELVTAMRKPPELRIDPNPEPVN